MNTPRQISQGKVDYPSSRLNSLFCRGIRALSILGVLSSVLAWASVGGSITGTVKDPARRVIPKASVAVREINCMRLAKHTVDSVRPLVETG
jgi:hypothetical protein